MLNWIVENWLNLLTFLLLIFAYVDLGYGQKNLFKQAERRVVRQTTFMLATLHRLEQRLKTNSLRDDKELERLIKVCDKANKENGGSGVTEPWPDPLDWLDDSSGSDEDGNP